MELTEAQTAEIKEALDAIKGARGDQAVVDENVARILEILGQTPGGGAPNP